MKDYTISVTKTQDNKFRAVLILGENKVIFEKECETHQNAIEEVVHAWERDRNT